MKLLDIITVQSIADIIDNRYGSYVIGGDDRVVAFFQRAGVHLDASMFSLFGMDSNAVFRIMHTFNGRDEFERVILRLASPKEHAGNRLVIGDMMHALDQALWPEGLMIQMAGPDPHLVEASAPSSSAQETDPNYNAQRLADTATVAQASDAVFIIHGRDEGGKDAVARFITMLGLRPIVLRELPGKGRTIIEKFEDYAQVGFAIALFTPDDVGGLEGAQSELKHRARQNVIFELGYFIGKFGRHSACVLHKGDVEIPSDYSGVEYIPLSDADGWKFSLVTELQGAGFDVDANKVTRR